MRFSKCTRCRAVIIETQDRLCNYCHYQEDSEESALPIPRWVTEQLSFQPWELREIREVNLGLNPIQISPTDESQRSKSNTVRELPQRRKGRWRRIRRDFFPIVQNGTIEI